MGAATSRPRSAIGFALLAVVSASLGAQTLQVYRYIDVDGRVVYSDRPPPPTAKEAQAKRIGANSIETSALSFATQQAQERYPVTFYSFACGVICDTAQGMLNKRGVPHTMVDVGQSDGADKLKKLTGGLDAPTLQVGDQFAIGFNETRWQGMLSDAGYPKTPPPRTAPVGRAPGPAAPEPTAATQTAQPTLPPKGGYPQQ